MSFLEAVAVAAVGIVAPGIAGVVQPGSSRAPHVALRFVAAAAILGFSAMVIRRILGIPATPLVYGVLLLALSAAAGLLGVRRGGRFPQPAREPLAWALAAAGFVLAAWAGLRVVPPLEDQDMEVQGTAYGLITELQPICLTNRGTLYFLAHPPLLHVYNASTLTLAGELDSVRPAYDAAVVLRAALPDSMRSPSIGRAMAAFTDPVPRPDRTLEWTRDVYGGFVRDPALLGTRAPNFVFAALLGLLLFHALRRVGASGPDAALLVLVQMTLPEIFVRSGYGGYFALSAVTFLIAGWLPAAGARGAAFGAGALAMLANQKSVIVGAASLALGAGRARPLILGMIAGSALFAAWGLAIAPEEFVSDHLREHGLARFVGGSHAGSETGAAALYPTRAGLWIEFARHSGWTWCACVAIALAAALPRIARRRAPGNAPSDPSEAESMVRVAAAWIVIGALLFTWTDWRQTKHLAKLVPAMTIVLGAFLAGSGPLVRSAFRAALAISLVWNAVWIVRLARDFTAISPTPLW